MSLTALQNAVTAWSEGRPPTLGEWAAAQEEIDALKQAAKGLGQGQSMAEWDQKAWNDGIDLMEAIAKEAE